MGTIENIWNLWNCGELLETFGWKCKELKGGWNFPIRTLSNFCLGLFGYLGALQVLYYLLFIFSGYADSRGNIGDDVRFDYQARDSQLHWPVRFHINFSHFGTNNVVITLGVFWATSCHLGLPCGCLEPIHEQVHKFCFQLY